MATVEQPHVTVSSYVPVETAEQLARLAREHERSVSGELRLALRRHLDAERHPAPDRPVCSPTTSPTTT